MLAIVSLAVAAYLGHLALGYVPWVAIGVLAAAFLIFPSVFVVLVLMGAAAYFVLRHL